MTTTDRLHEWTTSDLAFSMYEASIPFAVIKIKLKATATQVHRMVEIGRHRRELRMGVVDQIDQIVDPDWRLPNDVLIPTATTITCIQEGCKLHTLVEALRARE